ncbi:hypothetical protein CL1_0968 [Thermococcus cleftensis]|uniref:Transglutaminase-like domain-containing protein n=1 Tax=Thermococcus cleftensis (strain DSM 27260 / KACC 17922 / CL1) TaxID=163003 RepID=I3ZTY7_THECF|nr:hypothetical protein CL1_0968 [Thermococcus cleftensis]
MVSLLVVSVFSAGCIGGGQTSLTPTVTGSGVADSDGDGIPDSEEGKYGTNPNNKDTDGDGLSDGFELEHGIDPTLKDTDDDGLSDGFEVNVYNTSPRMKDTDGDGLSDGSEVHTYGSNPLSKDTDGDGIGDGDEVLRYGTDPLSADSDGDGLSDPSELSNYTTSPLSADTDGDGLGDYGEIFTYHTDPLRQDSDDDGLDDYSELAYGTNPWEEDSDNDTLLDGYEAQHGLDPISPDTDEDYLSDGYEVEIGTDPALDWRYGLDEETLKAGLSRIMRQQISGIARNLSSGSVLDRAWAILEWINATITYNHTKAEFVEESVVRWESLNETEKWLYLNLTRVQAINDTAYRLKSGICTDYALLTSGLLLEANVSPVYVLSIDYWNRSTGHATVAIKVNGTYLVLDQRLPPVPLGNYYWYSIYTGMGEIENVTVYRVSLDERGEVVVRNWTWRAERLKAMARAPGEGDIGSLGTLVEKLLVEKYPGYTKDERLRDLAEKDFGALLATGDYANGYLPGGFEKGWVLSSRHPLIGFYYTSLMAGKLVRYLWPGPDFDGGEWREILSQCDHYYLKIGKYGEITVRDHTGDSFEVPELLLVMEVAG